MNSYKKYLEYFNREHSQSFAILDGVGKVLVSAPHSVSQTREGKLKFSEPHTGVLARMMHDKIRCPAIFKLANLGDDANYDESCDYKTAILDYIRQNDIKFVLDLHQLAPSREVLINIGTGNHINLRDENILQMMKNKFEKHNLHGVMVDSPFMGAYPHTVSSFVARKGKIQSVQLEINSKIVIEDFEEFSFDKLLDALIDITKELGKLL